MSGAIGVIPVRWGSTRFPQKCLASIGGKSLTQWVWERALQAESLDELVIAADDERIIDAVQSFGGRAVMTRSDHPSGTDRVAEAAAVFDADVVVNIQGDEPLVDPKLIDELAHTLLNNEKWDMATACTLMTDAEEQQDPNCVKVVMAENGAALYFSRATIPYIRDPGLDPSTLMYRHLGLYAYRVPFLKKLVATPPCALEQAEKLEQLRALHLGARMCVLKTADQGLGVDTPEDVARAERALQKAGLL